MPVRPQFQPADSGPCRMALGLAPDKPVLLIMGGSQGASGVNELVSQALPRIVQHAPGVQFLHLTGPRDLEKVRAVYADAKCKAQVFPFLTEMELALGAATLAISRAGASSLAELAAMRVPSILVPYPAAADNHQLYNARALVDLGAAWLLEQADATPEILGGMTARLLADELARGRMSAALERWNVGNAAAQIAARLLVFIGVASADLLRQKNQTSHQPKIENAKLKRSSDEEIGPPLQVQTLPS